MKKWLLFAALLLAPALARAQGNTVTLAGTGAPSGSCAFIMLYINNSTGDMYNCWLGTWQLLATGGGGGISGSGTANTLTKWTAAAIIGDSQITDDGATITLPGTVNLSGLTASRCLELDGLKNIVVAAAACGTGSGANTALSNLASVSINTALLFQTGTDIGSITKPARDFYLYGSGTFGTTYFKLTGTPTSTRVVTLPDADSNTVVPGNCISGSAVSQVSGSGAITCSAFGTVNAATAGQLAYYATSTNAVSGNANATISNGALTLGVAGSVFGQLKLSGSTSGTVTISTPPSASAGTWTLTLPTDDGTVGQFLRTDGLGTTSWATPAGSGDITAVGSCTTGDCFTNVTPSTSLTFNNNTSGTMTLQTEQGVALGTSTATIPSVGGTFQTDQNTNGVPSCAADCFVVNNNSITPPTAFKSVPVAAMLIRPCEIHLGAVGTNTVALSDDNDGPQSCKNTYGATLTITAVSCWSDGGSPTVMPSITGGSNLLSGNLTCTQTDGGAAGTLNGTPTQASGATILMSIVAAGGTAHEITVVITRKLADAS